MKPFKMFWITVSLIMMEMFQLLNGLPTVDTGVSVREPKFFPFYTIGRFSNDVCVGTNSLVGSCLLSKQCADLGGTSTGTSSCSQTNTNQAACCILTQSCGTTTNTNNTYFVNSGYPATYGGGSRCNVVVTRSGTDVCQLKISFIDFSLAQPTGDGTCTLDYFTVTGGSSPVPRICGENTGSHVYVDFSGDNPMTITVASSSSFTFNRRWNLHLQMIGCDSTAKAPFGCLQYYQDTSATISSFNYMSTASGVLNSIGVQGSRQIANLNYGACIRAAPGQCSITWVRPSDPFAFSITGDVGAIDPAILGTAAVQDTNCLTDYVSIPAAQQGGVAAPGDRFCGLGLADTTSNARPFVIYSVTDGNETPDIGNPSMVFALGLLALTGKDFDSLSVVSSILMFLTTVSTVRGQDQDFDELEYFYDEWQGPHGHYHKTEYRHCNSEVDFNNTVLLNPNYPETFNDGTRCTYRIFRQSHHICQLRIDFLAFYLAQPTGDGLCTTDYFSVDGGSAPLVPRICGDNTGQHVYVNLNKRRNLDLPITLTIATTKTFNYPRRWQIRVSQIKCRSIYRAPANCLQYHISPTGFIRSFNYGTEESANFNSLGIIGSRQLASLDYNICIRRQALRCSIAYSRPSTDPYAFTLTDDVRSVDKSILGTVALQSQTCTTDFITIASPFLVSVLGVRTNLTGTNFCGLGLNTIHTLSTVVRVVTDANENADIANRGFYLNYVQNFCLGRTRL